MRNDIKLSGFAVLFIGVALLLFTFFNAYLFLIGASVSSSPEDLMRAFGGSLGPLIETAIRAVYLGVMGWIGSILTRRGVQTVISEREKGEPKRTAEQGTA